MLANLCNKEPKRSSSRPPPSSSSATVEPGFFASLILTPLTRPSFLLPLPAEELSHPKSIPFSLYEDPQAPAKSSLFRSVQHLSSLISTNFDPAKIWVVTPLAKQCLFFFSESLKPQNTSLEDSPVLWLLKKKSEKPFQHCCFYLALTNSEYDVFSF